MTCGARQTKHIPGTALHTNRISYDNHRVRLLVEFVSIRVTVRLALYTAGPDAYFLQMRVCIMQLLLTCSTIEPQHDVYRYQQHLPLTRALTRSPTGSSISSTSEHCRFSAPPPPSQEPELPHLVLR